LDFLTTDLVTFYSKTINLPLGVFDREYDVKYNRVGANILIDIDGVTDTIPLTGSTAFDLSVASTIVFGAVTTSGSLNTNMYVKEIVFSDFDTFNLNTRLEWKAGDLDYGKIVGTTFTGDLTLSTLTTQGSMFPYLANTPASATFVSDAFCDCNITKYSAGNVQFVTENNLTFLLTGQSNMAGRATPVNTTMPDNAKAWYWGASVFDKMTSIVTNAWRWFQAPNPAVEQDTLGIYFAKKLAETYPNVNINIIHVAAGGLDVDYWHNNGLYYQSCKTTVEEALAVLGADHIDGILWHQGESDDATLPATYKSKLDSVISDFQSESWFSSRGPFVVGELAPLQGAQNVSLALYGTDFSQPSMFVDCDPLAVLPDNLHFDHDGLVTLGENYADAVIAHIGSKTV